ncbi:MAG: hypothetical protein OEM97_11475 [Acidimicrobiia bacterium]|nr:hypothetical protein [Acidimicrobiia bacterium]
MHDTPPASTAEPSSPDPIAESPAAKLRRDTAVRGEDLAAAITSLELADPAEAPALADEIATALAAHLEGSTEPESSA